MGGFAYQTVQLPVGNATGLTRNSLENGDNELVSVFENEPPAHTKQ